MTYREALDFLDGLRMFGTWPGLGNAFRLAELAGNPQSQLRFIHVAGTNGKGSTCAMLESIYRAAGLKVGLYTSPHLVSFCERIQVNRRNIPQMKVARLVEFLKGFIESGQIHNPTLFEVATIMALKYFADQQCDLVIWETGLGGRLDATNIVTPLASVITNIQLDHVQWLGDSLEKIAAEKAGIIKPGIPVLTAADAPEALKVIRESARARGATLVEVSKSPDWFLKMSDLALKGSHQKTNAALALATVELLQPLISVTEGQIIQGLTEVNWPGRFQIIPQTNETSIILDGAHNPAGFKALSHALFELYPERKFTFIIGMLGDKSWRDCISTLLPFAHRIIAVPVNSDRSLSTAELAAYCRSRQLPNDCEIIECRTLSDSLKMTHSDEITVVTGSLYLMGEAIALLEMPAKDALEPPLNEWSQTSAPMAGMENLSGGASDPTTGPESRAD
jgi:dihydrofolate synthase/folylpolyglutamate synthase